MKSMMRALIVLTGLTLALWGSPAMAAPSIYLVPNPSVVGEKVTVVGQRVLRSI